MGLQAQIISYLQNRKPFPHSLSACPIFCRLNQNSADPVLTILRFNKPAFKISDMIAVTIFDKRPNTGFKKSDQFAGICFGNNHELGFLMFKNIHHFRVMLFIRRFIPQTLAKTKPFRKIFFLNRANIKLLLHICSIIRK